MLQGIGTNLSSLAVVAAAWLGATTFKSWRRQQYASRRAAEAEDILRATYRARAALDQIRSPFMSGYELEKAEETLNENPGYAAEPENKKRRLRTAQGYYNRLSYHRPIMDALDATLPMARALFGEELERSIENLRHQFWIVRVDAESYIDDDGSNAEFTKKIQYGLYKVKDDENEVTIAINAAIGVIEHTCLPVLRHEDRR